MLTIVGVSIIAGYVIPFVKSSLEGTECVKFRDYFSFDEEFNYNCYDLNNKYGISISAKSGDLNLSIEGFDLSFKTNVSSKLIGVRKGGLGSCLNGGIYMLEDAGGMPSACVEGNPLGIPGQEGYSAITYIFNSDNNNYKKVEVYPVVKGGKVCDMSDSIKLTVCDAGNIV